MKITKIGLMAILITVCQSDLNAQNIPSYLPSNGLVGWWPFTGNANDSSSNYNHGVVYGASLTTDRFGKSNSAYNFNVANWRWASAGDYIYIPYNAAYNFTEFTASAWVKRTSNGSTISPQPLGILRRYQYGYSNPNGEAFTLDIGHGTSSTGANLTGAVIQQSGSPAPFQYASSVQTINLNVWTNVVMTYKSKTINLYIDGVNVASSYDPNITINTIGNSGISIGISDQANGHWCPFDGAIDDIAIWNRALDSFEIKGVLNLCSKKITTQPLDINTSKRTASFTCDSDDTLESFQWQTKIKGVWVDLKDSAQFSGVKTGTLKLNNILKANNLQVFRCLIKGDCINRFSDSAILNYNCLASITQQPSDQGMYSGVATFSCNSNDTLVSYQWQSNLGMGWVNLNNAGQYSGALSNKLSVNNVSSLNNNQLFRCIVNGDCTIDTTLDASLKVWGLGINDLINHSISVYPNPSNSFFVIENKSLSNDKTFILKIYNSLGQEVFKSNFNQRVQIGTINIGAPGVYSLRLHNINDELVAIRKLVIE